MWEIYKVMEQICVSELYTLFKRRYQPGYSFSGESHDFWECVYVVRGNLHVTGDEKSYILSGGDMVFHKPLELHKLDVVGDKPVEVLTFSYTMNGPICDFFREKCFSLTLPQMEVVNSIISLIPYYIDEIQKKESKHFTPYYLSAERLQLVGEYIKTVLLLLYENGQLLQVSGKKEALAFQNMVTYMKQNLHRSLSIEDLGKQFFMSPTSIKRVFKMHSGMGVHAYFTKLKMARAVELLKEGSSVAETSDILGFGDGCYFSTVFKREMGMTVSEFKRQYKRE